MLAFAEILIAMLAVFGFYCMLDEIRRFLRRYAQKRNNRAEKTPHPFDNAP